MEVTRRKFLSWLGLAPAAAVAAMAALRLPGRAGAQVPGVTIREWEPWGRDRYGANQPHPPDRGMYEKEIPYLTSDTAWFISEETKARFEGLNVDWEGWRAGFGTGRDL